jgi:flagellar protein FliL
MAASTDTRPTGKGVADQSAETPAPAKKKKGKKKLVIILIAVLVLAAGAKFMLGGSAKKGGEAAKPKPGATLALDPVTVNLAGGHYLRVGLSVQFTDKVKAEALPDAAIATDQMISYFTGQDSGPLATAAGLEKAKAGLKDKIVAAYPEDPVYELLFTSWVVQ